MLNIVKFPDSILRERMPEFDFNDPVLFLNPKELEQEMIETMFAYDGIGLAAPQIGIQARVFVMGHRDNPKAAQAFFNPVVLANTEEIEVLEEGCLSFPGVFANIPRPKKIRARWQNSQGEFEEGEFEGYNCKCFLHELDHLEGIVFQDRISPLKWAMAVKKSQPKKPKIVKVKRKFR
jgi:peptide deformylase